MIPTEYEARIVHERFRAQCHQESLLHQLGAARAPIDLWWVIGLVRSVLAHVRLSHTVAGGSEAPA